VSRYNLKLLADLVPQMILLEIILFKFSNPFTGSNFSYFDLDTFSSYFIKRN